MDQCGNRYQPDAVTAYVCDQEAEHRDPHQGPAVAWDMHEGRPGRASWNNTAILLDLAGNPFPGTADGLLRKIGKVLKGSDLGADDRVTLIRDMIAEYDRNASGPRYGEPVDESADDGLG